MVSVAESVAVLPDDANQLKQMVVENHLKAQEWKQAYDKKEEERRELEAKFNLLRHAFFSRSSEKWTVDEKLQARLFDEAETAAEGETDTEPEVQMVAGYPRKNRGKRKPIPEDIPRDEIIYDIPEEEKACGCGAELTRIGEEVSEDLDIIPAELKATRHVRLKYGCRVCEGSGNEEGPAVKVAPGPKKLLAKSIATAGLVAHVVTSKYCDALPLYRQEKMFTRIGVDIKRSSMARWIIELGKRISPLLELMDEKIRSGPVVLMDETRVQVHNEPGREDHAQSFMWVARGGPPEKPYIRYMYHPTRSAAVPKAYLKNFKGRLQTDFYPGYLQIGGQDGIIHVNCLAHARRKLDEAVKATGGSRAASEFIAIIQKIYRAEKQLRKKDLPDDEFVRQRKEEVIPYFEKLEKHLQKKIDHVAPSSVLGKAIHYLHEVLPNIKRYLDSPYLTPDTNSVERAIRPFVIGRRNWIFSDTPRGAHASAAFYSLIESAKSSKLEPYWYIRYVLNRLPEIEETEEWEKLLPENLTSKSLRAPPS